jgi:hypothetical protein
LEEKDSPLAGEVALQAKRYYYQVPANEKFPSVVYTIRLDLKVRSELNTPISESMGPKQRVMSNRIVALPSKRL